MVKLLLEKLKNSKKYKAILLEQAGDGVQLKKDAESLEMECEMGDRSLAYPNATWLHDILHHSSSKHHAAAQEAMAESVIVTSS